METSYQVIARKYRPQRFADVVGQEHVTQTLGNAIAQKRIAHAYLFVGPRGTGKTTIARIFAKCLNCTDGPRVDFSDTDPRCQEITDGRSMDVLEIDGASNRGIEEIRELRETVKYAPSSSRFKIYIIDEVHMLTKEAFNALLKTLEEPPAHVKFMFATTEPEKVLATILSRCQRFDLRRIPDALIVQHLALIAKKESVKIEREALHAIARGADGGMRDAESTLDQLISFCGMEIVEADVLSMFGLAAQRQLLTLADAIIQGDQEKALRELDALATGGKDLGRLLADLLNYFRNLLVYLVSKGDVSLLAISETGQERLVAHAGLVTVEGVTRIMEVLADCESRFRDASSRKILMEVSLLRAMEARNAVSIDAVLRQLQQLRSDPDATAALGPPASLPARTSPPSPPGNVSPVPITANNAAPAAPAARRDALALPTKAPTSAPESLLVPPSLGTAVPPAAASALPSGGIALPTLWAQLVETVGRASPFTKTYLIEAHPVAFAKNVLTIGFDPEFADHLGLVDNSKVHTLLQTKLGELGHRGAQIKFIKSEAPPGWNQSLGLPAAPAPEKPAAPARPSAALTAAAPSTPPPPPVGKPKLESMPFRKEDFKNDPLIQKALEVFKGEIVEVRA